MKMLEMQGLQMSDSAYQGSEEHKNASLRLLASSLPREPDDQALIAWAADAGLPASLVLLAARSMLTQGPAEQAREAFSAFLSAIPPGTQLSPIAHQWVNWAWAEGSDFPVVPLGQLVVHDAAMRSICEQVVALHRDAAQGRAVPRAQWRPLRVTPLAEPPWQDVDAVVQHAAVEAVLASAWDFDQTPGAAADVFDAWVALLSRRIDASAGWTEADEALLVQRNLEAIEKVTAEIGPRPTEADPAARAAYREVFLARLGEAIQSDLGSHRDSLLTQFSVDYARLCGTCSEALLALTHEAKRGTFQTQADRLKTP